MAAEAAAVSDGPETTTGGSLGLRRLLTSAAGLAVGRGAASGLSAVWLIVAAHRLSIPDFGDLAILLASTTVLISVSDRGLQTALAIHTGVQGALDRQSMWRVLRGRFPVAVGCAVVNVGLFLAVAQTRDVRLPIIAAGSIVGTAVYGTLLAAYRSLGKYRLDAANDVLSRLAVLIVGTVLLRMGAGLMGAIACYAGADLASAVAVGVVVSRKHVTRALPAIAVDLRARATLPLAVVMVVVTIYYRVDTYLVGAIKGSAAAGMYSAAYRFLDLVSLLPMAVGSLIVARSARETAVERRRTLHRLLLLAVVAGVPVSAVGIVIARPVMQLVFGASFASAGTTLSVLLLSTAPTAFVAACLPVAVLGSRRQAMLLSMLVLGLNVCLNGVLIPFWGGIGAAVANLVSQLVLSAAIYVVAAAQASATSGSGGLSQTGAFS